MEEWYQYAKTDEKPDDIPSSPDIIYKNDGWIGSRDWLGNEYRILDQIIKYQDQLTGLVIEFHNCDLMFEKIKLFIEKLNLDLVHIHVNNFGILTKEGFPTVLELTFSPKKYNSKRSENDNNFPKRSIDQPNNKIHEDIDIVFCE